MAIKKLKDMKPGESGLIVALHGSGNVKLYVPGKSINNKSRPLKISMAFFLFYRNAGIVTNVLLRPCDIVKHCSFTTVRVTC